MADTLYDGHEGLARYPGQQVLYQWKKFEQLASLPHAAYLGQADPRANGDCWVICKAKGALNRGRFFKAPEPIGFTTQDLKKAYVKGEYSIRVANNQATAISIDQFAEGFVGVSGGVGAHAGATNRIMGNTAAAASSGTTYPEFRLELEYPMETAIPVTGELIITPHIWNGVEAPNVGTDDYVVGWSPIHVTNGYYFWAKVAGDILMKATATNITSGKAVTVTGTSTAADIGSVKIIGAGEQQVAITREAIDASTWGVGTLTLGLM